MKTFTSFVALLCSVAAFAGDGTEGSPYTLAEALSEKATTNFWLKADIKGLGKDGSQTVNDSELRTDTFALLNSGEAYLIAASYDIFGSLDLSDLTNTKDLLIEGRMMADTLWVRQVKGALSINISNGARGYHVAANYLVPQNVVATVVRGSYSTKNNDVTCVVGYSYFGDTVTTGKNSALILLAQDGSYDLTLASSEVAKSISGTTGLGAGKTVGLNTVTTKNRYLYRFEVSADFMGFRRNSDNMQEVTLESKDEVYLQVNASEKNFFGAYEFADEDKKVINWEGQTINDFASATTNLKKVIATHDDNKIYDLSGKISNGKQKGLFVQNGRLIIIK